MMVYSTEAGGGEGAPAGSDQPAPGFRETSDGQPQAPEEGARRRRRVRSVSVEATPSEQTILRSMAAKAAAKKGLSQILQISDDDFDSKAADAFCVFREGLNQCTSLPDAVANAIISELTDSTRVLEFLCRLALKQESHFWQVKLSLDVLLRSRPWKVVWRESGFRLRLPGSPVAEEEKRSSRDQAKNTPSTPKVSERASRFHSAPPQYCEAAPPDPARSPGAPAGTGEGAAQIAGEDRVEVTHQEAGGVPNTPKVNEQPSSEQLPRDVDGGTSTAEASVRGPSGNSGAPARSGGGAAQIAGADCVEVAQQLTHEGAARMLGVDSLEVAGAHIVLHHDYTGVADDQNEYYNILSASASVQTEVPEGLAAKLVEEVRPEVLGPKAMQALTQMQHELDAARGERDAARKQVALLDEVLGNGAARSGGVPQGEPSDHAGAEKLHERDWWSPPVPELRVADAGGAAPAAESQRIDASHASPRGAEPSRIEEACICILRRLGCGGCVGQPLQHHGQPFCSDGVSTIWSCWNQSHHLQFLWRSL